MCGQLKRWQYVLATSAISSALPVLILEGLSLGMGVPFAWLGLLARWIFVTTLFFLQILENHIRSVIQTGCCPVCASLLSLG
jgi:hypothetical protein